ncbi:hypothetical protein SDC9_80181 [bioreactor metagenome]|uniref:Uncharacterized protein n=1 Tax=bioreactor metagenome TaxID=1076179 RepID=A0A644Z685_9ZZZZ
MQGVSAVKAIAIAQSQGQKIYTINPSNRDTALPKLSLGGDVGAEIRNAIEAGKEVTFHENQINAYGWHGLGYVITDSDTGAGAYLINGTGNGAVLLFFAIIFFMMLFFIPAIIGVVTTAVLISTITINIAFLAAFLLMACII